MKFYNYTTIVDKVRHMAGKDLTVSECHRLAIQNVQDEQQMVEGYAETIMERDYYHFGEPYYKLFPSILEMLCSVSIDINGALVKFPYPAFCVRLPKDGNVLRDGNRVIQAMLVGEVPSHDKIDLKTVDGTVVKCDRFMRINYQDNLGNISAMDVGLLENETIGDALDRWGGHDSSHLECRPTITSPILLRKRIIATAVATALFGVDRHELILPDLPVEEITVRGRAKKRLAKEKRAREEQKCKHWLVGSEIDLPRPHVTYEGYSEPTGRELKFGHMRSGHMRMQPCGPKNSERKLVFIHPMVIRPDLPVRRQHGYRIKGMIR